MNKNSPVSFVNLTQQHADLKEEILAAIGNVLDHGHFVGGPEVRAFEEWWASACSVSHAIGVGSGTDALQLALMATGIGPGDEVVTSPNSFVASANAIRLVGATVRFADIGEDFNIDPHAVSAAVTARTRAVIPVHIAGRPAKVNEIIEQVPNDCVVIEDAAQAFGAKRNGRHVGGTGAIGCFSLHPLKILGACGDAGMVTCQDGTLATRVRRLGNHGIKRRQEDCDNAGMNSRLDSLQAAILQVKCRHVSQWIDTRRQFAAIYHERLAQFLTMPEESPGDFVTYATFPVLAPKRNAVMRHLKRKSIAAKIHYALPIHRLPAYRDQFREGQFPKAEQQARNGLSLPIHEGLAIDDIHQVCDAIVAFYCGSQKRQTATLAPA
ncbi:MAG: DegT/DnrJ/EryC1/StrS family aminotransferase [Phycisphaerae bacterium]